LNDKGKVMGDFTRRALVQGGSVLGAAGALAAPALLDWAKACAQTAPWKPEMGAQLFPAPMETFRAVGRRRMRSGDGRVHESYRRQGHH
jgi:hypothetical protein